jgi:hypothetical protein
VYFQACKGNLAAVEIVDLLIEQGSPLAIRNRDGVTPLDLIFNHVQNPVAVLQSKAVFPASMFRSQIHRICTFLGL